MTTLGRGGSDTSAVAIAAALNADRCQIFTDVDGVYTADPRKVAGARRLQEITYDEMLELATLGAQVLNNRSVEMAKKYNVELEVISSLNPIPGTIVKETTKMEKMLVRGVTKDKDVSKISIVGVEDVPGIAFKVFSQLAKNNINVDIILQSVGRDNTKDIVFTVSMANEDEAVECIKALPFIGDAKVFSDNTVAKVSVVGTRAQLQKCLRLSTARESTFRRFQQVRSKSPYLLTRRTQTRLFPQFTKPSSATTEINKALMHGTIFAPCIFVL